VDDMTHTARFGNVTPAMKPSNERLPWVASLRIPPLFRGLLPQPVRNGLRNLRVKILMSDFRGHTRIAQSTEDAIASSSMSIVVPIHDAPVVTRRCLVSLEHYAPKAEIILVNDGSKLTETANMIQGFVDRNHWKLVNHERPLGHSQASEAGVDLATRSYLCLLNSDTVVTPWCWRLVKEAFELDERIAVAGPSTSNTGIPQLQTLPIAAYLCRYLNDNQICDFASRLVASCADPLVSDLTFVCGFAFFMRRSAWNQFGGFDRNLPDYGNEVELCKRVAAEGYRRVWVRNAYIHHFGSQSYREAIGNKAIAERNNAALAYIRGKLRSPNPLSQRAE
jgi:GT2 family glycosyltransferase